MKFSFVLISFFTLILFLTHVLCLSQAVVCPAPVPERFVSVKPGHVVGAYVASWDKKTLYSIADIEQIADRLTHIFYAFAVPNAQTGTCDLPDEWASLGANFEHRKKIGGHFGQLLALKQKFPHLKIILSLGGGLHSTEFVQIVQKNLTAKFVESAVSLLSEYDYNFHHSVHGSGRNHRFEYPGLFSGIDLDWEWTTSSITPELVEGFHKMIKLFAHRLHRYGQKVHEKPIFTCAVQANPTVIKGLRLSLIADHVNWFNVMTYDFGGKFSPGVAMNAPICNPYSALSVDGTIDTLMREGITPEKLVLGIPLFGQVFDGAQEKIGSPFDQTEKTKPLRFNQIKEQYLQNAACYKKWHKKSMVPYVFCPVDRVFVSYDDERSAQMKAAYAKQKLLQGIFFWRLSGDDKEHHVIRAAVA